MRRLRYHNDYTIEKQKLRKLLLDEDMHGLWDKCGTDKSWSEFVHKAVGDGIIVEKKNRRAGASVKLLQAYR